MMENNIDKDEFDDKEDVDVDVVEEIEDVLSEEDEIQVLKNNLKEKETQIKETVDRLQRLAAEFDNFRKRTAKEKAGIYDNGIKDAAEKMLPVADNFERALASPPLDTNDNFYKGVEMIFKQFKSALESIGITEIKALGETFDPNIHSAVAHIADENFGEGEIIEDMQKGYMYKGKAIRPSMVKVAN